MAEAKVNPHGALEGKVAIVTRHWARAISVLATRMSLRGRSFNISSSSSKYSLSRNPDVAFGLAARHMPAEISTVRPLARASGLPAGFNVIGGNSATPQVILNALHALTDVKILSNRRWWSSTTARRRRKWAIRCR